MATDQECILGALLKQFLIDPQEGFLPLFHDVRVRVCRYLGSLRAGKRSLPLLDRTDKDPLPYLAVDVLATLFSSDRGEPFGLIFRFFRKNGITDYKQAEPDQLEQLFLPMLTKHVKQELYDLRNAEMPDVAKVRKGLEAILTPPEYTAVTNSNGSDRQICNRRYSDDLRREARIVDQTVLEELGQASLLQTTKRTDLCRELFRLLNERTDFQNFVRRRLLIHILVQVIDSYCKQGFPSPVCLPTPDEYLLLVQIERAKTKSLDRLEQVNLARLAAKGMISSDETDSILQACANYLEDRFNGDKADPKPRYFIEVMPKEACDRYYQDYRYNFEQLLEKAVQYVREEMTRIVKKGSLES